MVCFDFLTFCNKTWYTIQVFIISYIFKYVNKKKGYIITKVIFN